MKKMSSRKFFHHPTAVKELAPGQAVTVTQNGKPSFTVIKAGGRPRKTKADLDREARRIVKRRGIVMDIASGIGRIR